MSSVTNLPATMDKHGGKPELLNDHTYLIRDIGKKIGGAVTARYYKGLSADGDNLIIVIKSKGENKNG